MMLLQALREELRRQRSSTYFTRDKDEETTTLLVDSEHNKHLESEITKYIYFAFVIKVSV